jgi:hypothetical protein
VDETERVRDRINFADLASIGPDGFSVIIPTNMIRSSALTGLGRNDKRDQELTNYVVDFAVHQVFKQSLKTPTLLVKELKSCRYRILCL